jgi:transposase
LVREHPFEEQELADKLRILRQIRYKTPAIEAIAAFKDDIEGWIKEPSFTIKRIWQRLATEPGVSVAYASVRRYLKRQFPVETHAVTLRLTATPKCIRSVIRGNVSLARLTASADSWICRKVRNRNDEQWIKKLMRGTISLDELGCDIGGRIPPEDIAKLHECALNRPVRYRNRAVSILALLKGISRKRISEYLLMARKSVNRNYAMYRSRGVEWIISDKGKKQLKEDDPAYVDKVFSILHSPPSSFGFNRTSWRQADIKKVLEDNDMPLSKHGIRSIISKSGFKYRKAKTVLTSNDPEYKAKLQAIKTSLANLGPREKFFSIDEYGPFAVKLKGGTSLVPAGTLKTVPQWQKSKGCMILTAALELSTNQVTHFYSKRKNTAEMIRLLDILLEKYADEERIYFSWDAASWHASKELYKRVDTINSDECRSQRNSPLVKLAPLPSSAQFLNVIESVFSGMAKAIIHNSDYQSVDECQSAIDRYFHERNEHFKKHPKRAGNRIWGRERVEATFKESNNCKDPMYR